MECNNEQNRQQRYREWGFTFFGGTFETLWEQQDSTEAAPQSAGNDSGALAPFPLALSKVGDRLWIVGIRGKEVTNRLLALRLTPGTELTIVSRAPSGSVVVAFQDKRIGLGAGMADNILVRDTINHVSTSSEAKLMNRDTNTYLCNLPVGCRGRVVGYERVTGGYKGRLLAMGLTPGTEFTVISHGSLGDPIEIEVQGLKLSLRKHEADVLCIEEVSDN